MTITPFIYFGCSNAIMNKKQLKPDLKLADKFLDLKTLDTNIILNHLDEQIKLRDSANLLMNKRNLDSAQEPQFLTVREMPIEKRLKRDMLK